MKINAKGSFTKIRLSKDQVAKIRATLKGCEFTPITYAGAVLLSQGCGWYQVAPQRAEYDFASDEELIRGMIRKIRAIINAQAVEAKVDYSKPNVGRQHCDTGLPIPVSPELQRRIDKTANFSIHYGMTKTSTSTSPSAQQLPKSGLAPKLMVPENRLQALVSRINNKFHRA